MECYEKISVIIPAYNCEKSIEKCIESIIKQEYPNYEMIIIDDGSTDKTGKIIEKYIDRDAVKIVHKNNGGVSSARNVGIQMASGTYVMFVDADDRILENGLWILNSSIQKFRDADVIIYGWIEEKHAKQNKKIPRVVTEASRYINKEKCIEKIITTEYGCGGGYPWNKIWKRDCLMQNKSILLYNENLILCEDKEWTIRAILNSEKILLIKNLIYNYTVSDGEHLSKIDFDIVNEHNNKKIISFLEASNKIKDTLSSGVVSSEVCKLSKSLFERDLIMVCYKAIRRKNSKLVEYVLPMYDKFINGERVRIGVKYKIMRCFIYCFRYIKY